MHKGTGFPADFSQTLSDTNDVCSPHMSTFSPLSNAWSTFKVASFTDSPLTGATENHRSKQGLCTQQQWRLCSYSVCFSLLNAPLTVHARGPRLTLLPCALVHHSPLPKPACRSGTRATPFPGLTTFPLQTLKHLLLEPNMLAFNCRMFYLVYSWSFSTATRTVYSPVRLFCVSTGQVLNTDDYLSKQEWLGAALKKLKHQLGMF